MPSTCNADRVRGKKVHAGPITATEKKAKSREYTTVYQTQEIDVSPFVAPSTAKARNKIWGEWLQHCEDASTESVSAWTMFLRNSQSSEGQAPFRAFLRTYVESSVKKTLVLGPEEFVYVRTVDMAFTVQEVWRRLVAAAENHVMSALRQQYPSEASTWRLRWMSKEEGKKEGPAFRIVQWIFQELAPEIGLCTDPSYRKIEMTSTDVDVILTTLWSESHNIPCDPDTRVDFHAFILFAAIGGFRRGTILKVKYNQFRVAVVRDPEDRSRRKIVVTITIKRNKIKETAKTTRLRNGGYIGFSITLVPYRVFCLASLIITRAIQRNAFEAEFKTIDEIFDQPDLEESDFVPLKWKPDFAPKTAFSISSSTADTLWYLVLLVAGLREAARLYSLRVGAGARMDGVISDALRNYVMSHSTGVFESSYQGHDVRKSLMELAFGTRAGKEELLFERLRDTSLSRDPNAPIRISPEDEQRFESRNDIRQLRSAIATTHDRGEKNKLRASLQSNLTTLRRLRLEEIRAEYFKHVDFMRAKGLSTAMYGLSSRNSGVLKTPIAVMVTSLLKPSANESVADRDLMTRRYMKAVLGFLTDSTTNNEKLLISTVPSPKVIDGKINEKSRCLLCKKTFCDRSALTRHYNGHIALFDQPFPCPECDSYSTTAIDSLGRAEWSNHVERTHGRRNAPNWSQSKNSESFGCLICSSTHTSFTALIGHINRHNGSSQQTWPMSCAECVRMGKPEVKLGSLWSLLEHLQVIHIPSAKFCGLCGHICSTSSGLTRHFTLKHKKDFETPLSCPACNDAGEKPMEIDGFAAWQSHVSCDHSSWNLYSTSPKVVESFEMYKDGSLSTTKSLAPHKRQREDLEDYSNEFSDNENFDETKFYTTMNGVNTALQVGFIPEQNNVVTRAEHIAPGDDEPSYITLQASNHYPDHERDRCDVRSNSSAPLIGEMSSNQILDFIDPALQLCTTQIDLGNMLTLDHSCNDSEANNNFDNAEIDYSIAEDLRSQEFTVDCILERWKKGQFLLKWFIDGTCSWVARADINDKLLQDFEINYKGFRQGVTVLRNRRRNGKLEYRVRWEGRPSIEDSWVQEKDLDPEFAADLRGDLPLKPAKKRRRVH